MGDPQLVEEGFDQLVPGRSQFRRPVGPQHCQGLQEHRLLQDDDLPPAGPSGLHSSEEARMRYPLETAKSLKGAAVLMDPQARQALPMLPYRSEAGGAGKARCREGLYQGSGAAAQGSAVRRSARGSTSCSKKSRRRQYGARRSPISCRGEARGGQKASLMRELDMLELKRKLMQGTIELVGKGTGGDLARGLTNRDKTILVDALRKPMEGTASTTRSQPTLRSVWSSVSAGYPAS
jgi:hypothetical protein